MKGAGGGGGLRSGRPYVRSRRKQAPSLRPSLRFSQAAIGRGVGRSGRFRSGGGLRCPHAVPSAATPPSLQRPALPPSSGLASATSPLQRLAALPRLRGSSATASPAVFFLCGTGRSSLSQRASRIRSGGSLPLPRLRCHYHASASPRTNRATPADRFQCSLARAEPRSRRLPQPPSQIQSAAGPPSATRRRALVRHCSGDTPTARHAGATHLRSASQAGPAPFPSATAPRRMMRPSPLFPTGSNSPLPARSQPTPKTRAA